MLIKSRFLDAGILVFIVLSTYNPTLGVIWGSGSPDWGDPRNVCTRQFSKHLVWLCRKKSVSAAEAAEELHVPTVYVEEELEILRRGENGQYGLLRRLDSGRNAMARYAIILQKNQAFL